MKIAILGYGRMGKEIEKSALERNHEIVLIIDINNQNDFTTDNLRKAEVAIDFSVPRAAYKNIITCFEAGIPIVSGTTGWLDKFDEVSRICKQQNCTLFYASNFSIGVNVLFNINKHLARLMNRFEEYDVRIDETHHTQKLDAPSGTAISLAADIIKELDRKAEWMLDKQENPGALRINSHRVENVPGIHVVKYDSDIDHIEITHSAKSRKGFSLGAVLAAEFILDKKGVFSMNDLLGF